jgi:hypothetical protein
MPRFLYIGHRVVSQPVDPPRPHKHAVEHREQLDLPPGSPHARPPSTLRCGRPSGPRVAAIRTRARGARGSPSGSRPPSTACDRDRARRSAGTRRTRRRTSPRYAPSPAASRRAPGRARPAARPQPSAWCTNPRAAGHAPSTRGRSCDGSGAHQAAGTWLARLVREPPRAGKRVPRLASSRDIVGTRSTLAPQPAKEKRPALAGLCSMPPPGSNLEPSK